ncbi:hypothetical protein BGX21_010723 [Mortierella sp. AD011]|nr:hypothetical protein BGX20_010803 [Mortierella sp. AD010]KAF9393549.1 hypothetical protein BGX21_010723 [Mortierella sp. AD011]
MIISQGSTDCPMYRHCSDVEEAYKYDYSITFDRERREDSTTVYSGVNHAKNMDPFAYMERVRSAPIDTLNDIELAGWLSVGGFWGREIASALPVKMMFLAAPAEFATNISHLLVLRKKLVQLNKAADDLNDDILRAQSRRNILEFMDIRVRRRIMTGCNDPVPYGDLKGIHALAVGGNWSGLTSEWAVARWPDLPRQPYPLLDGIAAFTNAIASFHRDAYDGSTNSLDGIYGFGSKEVCHDLRKIATTVRSTKGSLRIAYLHLFCLNYGKRYALWTDLAVMIRQPIHVNKSSFDQCLQDIFGPSVDQDNHKKMYQTFSDIIDVVTRAFEVLSAKNALLSPEPWKSQIRAVNSIFVTSLCNHLVDGCSAKAATVAAQLLLNAVANLEWTSPSEYDPSRTALAATNGKGAIIEAMVPPTA